LPDPKLLVGAVQGSTAVQWLLLHSPVILVFQRNPSGGYYLSTKAPHKMVRYNFSSSLATTITMNMLARWCCLNIRPEN
jgi:hypothetical protein